MSFLTPVNYERRRAEKSANVEHKFSTSQLPGSPRTKRVNSSRSRWPRSHTRCQLERKHIHTLAGLGGKVAQRGKVRSVSCSPSSSRFLSRAEFVPHLGNWAADGPDCLPWVPASPCSPLCFKRASRLAESNWSRGLERGLRSGVPQTLGRPPPASGRGLFSAKASSPPPP